MQLRSHESRKVPFVQEWALEGTLRSNQGRFGVSGGVLKNSFD